MSSEVIEYCICRRNNADGFMICCDKCNEWFHGECIGLNEDMGLLYDVYYCIACKKKNAKLKSTFKTPPIAAASLSIHTGVVLPNKLDKVKVPISPERQKPEPQQEIVATPEQSSGSPTIENTVEVAMPVVSIENKVHEREKFVKGESKGCQCNLYLESSEESKKRPKCWGYMCDEIARPKSRYCSDECGSVATVTRIFSTMQPLDNGWTMPHPIFTLPDDYLRH
ncbi:uncharacterized protein Dwil_GK27940 [Drosophila willistoni]|uniref:PHD-type domain-containing protein n=1 Tax=Drosophila willistoni TaxID=7260 RepID=A0A0Q9WQL3_DROWI|nr:uncharacterized protein Dwil_GK27940 [Drosophila willistoni]